MINLESEAITADRMTVNEPEFGEAVFNQTGAVFSGEFDKRFQTWYSHGDREFPPLADLMARSLITGGKAGLSYFINRGGIAAPIRIMSRFQGDLVVSAAGIIESALTNTARTAEHEDVDGLILRSYVALAEKLPQVRRVVSKRSAAGLAVWTLIEAPPFDRSFRNPVYEAELAALGSSEASISFRLINSAESVFSIPQDAEVLLSR